MADSPLIPIAAGIGLGAATVATGGGALVAVGVGTAAAGAALSAQGQMRSANARQDAAEANAEILRNEQEIVGVQQIRRERSIRQEMRRTIARQRVLTAKAGFAEGATVSQLADQTAYEAEMEALGVRYGAAIDVTRLEQQANEQSFLGQLGVSEARQGALGTLVGAAGQSALTLSGLPGKGPSTNTGTIVSPTSVQRGF